MRKIFVALITLSLSLTLAAADAEVGPSARMQRILAQVKKERAEAQAQAQAIEDNQSFNIIRRSGAVFTKTDGRDYPVCKTKTAYIQYISYLTGRRSTLPEEDLCWELEYGTEVEFAPNATQDKHCTPSAGVCEFQYESYSLFRPNFWTSYHTFLYSR